MSGEYAVEVKPSARRINGAAGEHVNRHGPVRRFDSKADARAWAAAISAEDAAVRIQDAAPNDPSSVDGYLVADPLRRRHGTPKRPDLATALLDEF